jgi:hypothetical protein
MSIDPVRYRVACVLAGFESLGGNVTKTTPTIFLCAFDLSTYMDQGKKLRFFSATMPQTASIYWLITAQNTPSSMEIKHVLEIWSILQTLEKIRRSPCKSLASEASAK